MKIKKILAAVAAAAVAISAMTVNALALSTKDYLKDNTVFLAADKEGDPTWAKDAGVALTDVYGVTYHVTFDAAEVADEAAWIGGGIGANSPSTGWKQVEWGRKDKAITCDLTAGTITWLSDAAVFKADDAYAQFWLQAWGGKVTVNSADVLGKGGTILSVDAAVTEVAAVEEEAAVVDAAPVEDAAAEEITADVEDAAEEITVDVEEDVAVEDTAVVEDEAAVVTDAVVTADTTTTAAATGNTAAAVIVSVMAVAAAAAVVSKKVK